MVRGIYDRSVRDDAVQDATAFAELTFNAMFELMSTGWNRRQLEGFPGAIQKSVDQSQREIDIYRGPKVSALFGEIAQKTPDAEIERALKEGNRQRIDTGDIIRVVYPLQAQEVCRKFSDLRAGSQADRSGLFRIHSVASEVRQLTERIRAIAVDKDMLEFEIRLLEN